MFFGVLGCTRLITVLSEGLPLRQSASHGTVDRFLLRQLTVTKLHSTASALQPSTLTISSRELRHSSRCPWPHAHAPSPNDWQRHGYLSLWMQSRSTLAYTYLTLGPNAVLPIACGLGLPCAAFKVPGANVPEIRCTACVLADVRG